ncbi:MAG: hypothetical protein AAGF12_15185 [Myxococcota bacterium]
MPRTPSTDAAVNPDVTPPDASIPDAPIEPDASPEAGPPERDPDARILLLGSQFSAVGLAEALTELSAATSTIRLGVETMTPRNAKLEDHLASDGLVDRLMNEDFDAVVFQGHPLEPVLDPGGFQSAAEELGAVARSAGNQPLWLATPARSADDPIYFSIGGDPASMTRQVEALYRRISQEPSDLTARVGAAWELARQELATVDLYAIDGRTPSPEGTLLNACVLFHTLTGNVPEVPSPAPLGVDSIVADLLCALAPRVQCDDTKAQCGGTCVDLETDPAHCGGCGIGCAPGEPCRGGVCGCEAQETACGGNCVDVRSDPQHCGACGNVCAAGTPCVGGRCGCPFSQPISVNRALLQEVTPECSDWTKLERPTCMSATHRLCAAQSCFQSGFGPPLGSLPSGAPAVCLQATPAATSYRELRTFESRCDGVEAQSGRPCVTAIHRLCVALGHVTGFGPVETVGTHLQVSCLSEAMILRTTATELDRYARCPTGDDLSCTAATWQFCEAAGFPGGYGPVESSGNDVDVVCFQ